MSKLKDSKFHKVGLAFSSDFTQLELAWVNTSTGDIVQAGHIPITCVNVNTRAIEDEEALKESILALYDSLGVPNDLHVTVVLPSLYTRMIPMPSGLPNEELGMALVSEAERSVLFKRNTPQVDWIKLSETEDGMSQILLSSYPASEITTLINCLESLKLPVVAIDTHLTSLLRGLSSTGTIADDTEKRLVCVVSYTNFAILVLAGTRVETLIEVPLSTQGVTEEQILLDIDQDLQGLGDILYDCSQAIVVKNNPLITAEGLAKSFSRFSEVVLVEQSPETIASLGSEQFLYPCTVEVLGATQYETLEQQLSSFNFIPLEKQSFTYIRKARKKVLWAMVGLNAVAAMIVLAIAGIFLLFNVLKGSELDALKKELPTYSNVNVDQNQLLENLWINKNAEHNQTVLLWLVDIQKKLPASSWFKALNLTFNAGNAMLSVDGGSQSANDLSIYRSQLKPSFISAELKSKIEPAVLALKETKTASASTPANLGTKPAEALATDANSSLQYFAWSVTGGQAETATAAPAGASAATAAPAAAPTAAPTSH